MSKGENGIFPSPSFSLDESKMAVNKKNRPTSLLNEEQWTGQILSASSTVERMKSAAKGSKSPISLSIWP